MSTEAADPQAPTPESATPEAAAPTARSRAASPPIVEAGAVGTGTVGTGAVGAGPTEPHEQPASRVRRLADRVSLRVQLTAIVVLSLLVALSLTNWGVQTSFSRYLNDTTQADLAKWRQAVNHGRPGSEGDGDDILRWMTGDRPPPFGPSGASVEFLRLDGSTQLLARQSSDSATTPFTAEQVPVTGSADAARRGSSFFTINDTNGHPWLATAFPFAINLNGTQIQGAHVLALSLDKNADSARRLAVFIALIGGAVIVGCSSLGWLAIRRALRPLQEVEETAAGIAKGDLSRRIPERPVSTEVGSLGASLNTMLGQIEAAFRAREASEARTRRFAADASHELRTPLASIRGFAELYRIGAVPTEEVPRTLQRIESEAARMGSLVEDLLLLARLDEQRPARADPVDLAVLAGDAAHDTLGLDPTRTIRLVGLDGHGPRAAVVTGDDHRLRQVVANLAGNAVRHTPEGTPIEIAVGVRRGKAVLEVRDHGDGLPPDQAERIFERFYRLDASRQRGMGGGAGLGLSIVAAVVASHGGTVQVLDTEGGGATFRVELPLRG